MTSVCQPKNHRFFQCIFYQTKLQNSNITQSGNFPPILTNVTNDKDNDNIISPFEIENTNTINDSYITLKDLYVTPIQETLSINEIEKYETKDLIIMGILLLIILFVGDKTIKNKAKKKLKNYLR